MTIVTYFIYMFTSAVVPLALGLVSLYTAWRIVRMVDPEPNLFTLIIGFCGGTVFVVAVLIFVRLIAGTL